MKKKDAQQIDREIPEQMTELGRGVTGLGGLGGLGINNGND